VKLTYFQYKGRGHFSAACVCSQGPPRDPGNGGCHALAIKSELPCHWTNISSNERKTIQFVLQIKKGSRFPECAGGSRSATDRFVTAMKLGKSTRANSHIKRTGVLVRNLEKKP